MLDLILFLTSIVCIKSAITPLIFNSTSAFVTSPNALDVILIAALHMDSQSSST